MTPYGRAADLDWIVGPGYSSGGYIFDKNHEKPTWNHEKTMKTDLELWKTDLEALKTTKTDLEPLKTIK